MRLFAECDGLLFGGLIGLVIGLMESNLALGLVLTLAMTLNLVLSCADGRNHPDVVLSSWLGPRGRCQRVVDRGHRRISHVPRSSDANSAASYGYINSYSFLLKRPLYMD